ncbi:endonuclease domain-containing protein [Streptomyces sp. NPDC056169]|uniref:endonuclease domain-containing protein n=1 Tax=Streptomyces sp. NPDC056169 TaxID=3345734 RepID=UPI0035D881C1
MITPEEARRMLAELTEDCAVPAAPPGLSRYWFQRHGHVLIGDVAVRGYKYKNRWQLDDREIRKAAQRLAALVVDPADRVDALPSPSSSPGGYTWQSRIKAFMDEAAFRARASYGCPCAPEPCHQSQPNSEGLPCGLTWEVLERRGGDFTIAGTRPVPWLSWSGTRWTVPRAYAELLYRADEAEEHLQDEAAVCSGCGTKGDSWQWRTSSAAGFVTLCPACSSQASRPYAGHLAGALHASLTKKQQADVFLCCLCPAPRRALYWDHCHVHGFVRGPVCASCNTFEGGGWEFIRRQGALSHLLRCTGCHKARALPPRHHPDIVQESIVFRSHGSCTHRPRVCWGRAEGDGSVVFELSCSRHTKNGSDVRWRRVIPADRVAELVRVFVERNLPQ